MTITYNLLASHLPSIIAPPDPTLGNGSAGPFATGMTIGTTNRLNQLSQSLNLIGQAGGAGFGIVNGLDLTVASGLNITLTPGIALLSAPLELVNSNAFGTQVNLPAPFTLPDNSTSFVWLTQTGGITASTSISPPGTAAVLLGIVTTLSGAITGIDYSGRLSRIGGELIRKTADLGPPTDLPPSSIRLRTTTLGGDYYWNGSAHCNLINPVAQLVLPSQVLNPAPAALVLTNVSPNIIWLVPNGAASTVTLPAPTSITAGHRYCIVNSGDATIAAQNYAISLLDNAGRTLCTISPGQQADARLAPGPAASFMWPATLSPTSASV